MLNTAQKFERAFERFADEDPFFRLEIGFDPGMPVEEDWNVVRRLVTFLECFYLVTNRVSGTSYVTANRFFFEVGGLQTRLNQMTKDSDPEFRLMAERMKAKFDKYWGNIDKMNKLIYIAVLLDPRRKMVSLALALQGIYGEEKANDLVHLVKEVAFSLFEEYKEMYAPATGQCSGSGGSGVVASNSLSYGENEFDLERMVSQQLKQQRVSNTGESAFIKNDLERYLNEALEDDSDPNFDLLSWWKINSARFTILSRLARDVLAMPISTVASESAFSTGGRTLDQFRSSLTPKVVQALICAQDWMRTTTRTINVEEDLEELDKLEKDFEKTGMEDVVIDVS